VMLKLHGYIVPDNVPANEFMNLEGDKMSTSRKWKLDMQEYIDDFVKKENGGPQMVDALRYYLTAIAPETKDSEFTWKGFQKSVNGEVVDKFGNFFNRAFVLMHKLTKGKVPKFHNEQMDDEDKAMIANLGSVKSKVEELIEQYKFRDALFEVIMLSDAANKYLQKKEPWKKANQLNEAGQITDEAQVLIDNSIHICLQVCANLAVLINPFLPNTAKKMCHLMKVVDKMLEWENAGKTKLLSVGYSLRAPELLFRKIEDGEIEIQIQKLNKIRENYKMEMEKASGSELQTKSGSPDKKAVSEENKVSEISKSEIQYDDFGKLDLRIGTITSAVKVEKADKLLKLEVNLGSASRTIVSGIAQHFSPESLINKQVIVVANLAPRKMRGIESQGMILTAEQPDGKLILVNPDSLTENGSSVR
jgi:methionyl-tRNA synthetase